jgi:hypothetical protein
LRSCPFNDGARLPYALAVADDDPHRDAILEAAADYAGMMAALGSAR